jgi:hypothetical protein
MTSFRLAFRLVLPRSGLDWCGLLRSGLVWSGLGRSGLIRPGPVCVGLSDKRSPVQLSSPVVQSRSCGPLQTPKFGNTE